MTFTERFTKEWYRGYAYELRFNGMVYQVVIPALRVVAYCDVVEDCREWARSMINKMLGEGV